MKKSILLIAMVAVAALSALAVTDGQTYPEVNGIKIVNQWIFDRVHSGTAYTSNDICISAPTPSHSRSSTASRPLTAASCPTCR